MKLYSIENDSIFATKILNESEKQISFTFVDSELDSPTVWHKKRTFVIKGKKLLRLRHDKELFGVFGCGWLRYMDKGEALMVCANNQYKRDQEENRMRKASKRLAALSNEEKEKELINIENRQVVWKE